MNTALAKVCLCGTIALIRCADNLRHQHLCYRFFVRDASGEFQPLGDTTRVAVPARDDRACFVGGPDGVVDLETESKGVFGLSFDELLGSARTTRSASRFASRRLS